MEHPSIAATINEYYMPASKSARECDSDGAVTYIPAWIAQAEVRAENNTYQYFSTKTISALIDDENIRGTGIRWENYECEPFDLKSLMNCSEFDDAEYQEPPVWMLDPKLAKTYETDFVNDIYRGAGTSVWVNKKLKVTGDISDGEEDFIQKCRDKAQPQIDAEIEKLSRTAETKIKSVEDKLEKAMLILEEKNSNQKMRIVQTAGSAVELALSLFGKGRKRSVSTSLNKVGQTSTAKKAVEKAELDVQNLTEQLEGLKDDLEAKTQAVRDRWDEIIDQREEVKISVAKKDIFVDAFGICWMPYYKNSVGKLVRAYD